MKPGTRWILGGIFVMLVVSLIVFGTTKSLKPGAINYWFFVLGESVVFTMGFVQVLIGVKLNIKNKKNGLSKN